MRIVLFLIEHHIIIRTVRLLSILLWGSLVDHALVNSFEIFEFVLSAIHWRLRLSSFHWHPIFLGKVLVDVKAFNFVDWQVGQILFYALSFDLIVSFPKLHNANDGSKLNKSKEHHLVLVISPIPLQHEGQKDIDREGS